MHPTWSLRHIPTTGEWSSSSSVFMKWATLYKLYSATTAIALPTGRREGRAAARRVPSALSSSESCEFLRCGGTVRGGGVGLTNAHTRLRYCDMTGEQKSVSAAVETH